MADASQGPVRTAEDVAHGQTTNNWAARRLIGLAAAAAAGLVLAMAGSLASSGPTEIGGAARRLVVDLPDWLTTLLIVVLSAIVLLVLFLMASRPRLRRKKKDDELYQRYYEPQKLTPGALAFILFLALLPVGLAGAIFWFTQVQAPISQGESHPSPALTPSARPVPPGSSPVVPIPMHSLAASRVLGALALLAAVAALGVVLWLVFGGRIGLARGKRPAGFIPGLRAAVENSLEDVGLEPDPRRAIIKTYGRFESVLASKGLPRAPWQTALEYMRAALRWTQLPQNAVGSLTHLFELARFSPHSLTAADRETAWRSLVAIKAELDRRGGDASSS